MGAGFFVARSLEFEHRGAGTSAVSENFNPRARTSTPERELQPQSENFNPRVRTSTPERELPPEVVRRVMRVVVSGSSVGEHVVNQRNGHGIHGNRLYLRGTPLNSEFLLRDKHPELSKTIKN